MAPGLLNSDILGIQTLEHVMRVSRTWDSIISLFPKGGDTIWGGMDWSPEENHFCDSSKTKNHKPVDVTQNTSDVARLNRFQVVEPTRYGRIVSFGKEASELHSSELSTLASQVNIYVYFFKC